jgi:hypothetical protein
VVAPDPIPKVIPIIINKKGKTYPNAAKAVPPTHLPMKAVSTSIYIACTAMPNIMGRDNFHNAFMGLEAPP